MKTLPPDTVRTARRRNLARRVELGVGASALAVAVVAMVLWAQGTAGTAPVEPGAGIESGIPMLEVLAREGDVTFLQGGKALILTALNLHANFRVRLAENARIVLRLARNLVIGLSREVDMEFRPEAGGRAVTFFLHGGTSRVAIDSGLPGEPTAVRIQTSVADLEASYASFEATVLPDGLYVTVDKGVVRVTVTASRREILLVAGARLFVGKEGEVVRFEEEADRAKGPKGPRGSGAEDYARAKGGPLVRSLKDARAKAEEIEKETDPVKVVRRIIFDTREDLENLDIEACIRRARWPFQYKGEKIKRETVIKAYDIMVARFKKVRVELPGERLWVKEKLQIAQVSETRVIARYPCRISLTGRYGREEDRVKWKDFDVTIEFEKAGSRWIAVSFDHPEDVPLWVTKPEEYKKLQEGTVR